MIFVGIDPGVETGVAIWDSEKQEFKSIKSRNIIEAMADVRLLTVTYRNIKLIIEDARQRTWFGTIKGTKEDRNKAQGVGSVKRDCKIWEEFCEFNKLDYELKHPKTKLKAPDFKKITGWQKQTNEHGRDAAMLVFKR